MLKPLPFDTLMQVRAKLIEACPTIGAVGQYAKPEWKPFAGKTGDLTTTAFTPVIDNFYMTDPISRSSPTMAKCTAEILPLMEAAE
jgi:NADH-quinone oxidoreductase subunit G